MAARYLVSNPCEDGCGTLSTGRTVEGAPVYRCAGCDSEWIELHERVADSGATPVPGSEQPVAGVVHADSPNAPGRYGT
jgi:hypothetical protein